MYELFKSYNFQDKIDETGISYPVQYGGVRKQPIIPDNLPFPCNVRFGRYNSVQLKLITFEAQCWKINNNFMSLILSLSSLFLLVDTQDFVYTYDFLCLYIFRQYNNINKAKKVLQFELYLIFVQIRTNNRMMNIRTKYDFKYIIDPRRYQTTFID